MRTAEQNKRAQIVYDTAYFVLPPRAHADIEELKSEFEESPDLAAIFYFTLAAKRRGVEPNTEDVRALRGHVGRLESGWDFIVVEYPRFPAVDLLAGSDGSPPGGGSYVLAPYFSAVVHHRDAEEVRYFVLGQSPDARTTLRAVSSRMNANLGPGCEPELEAFLDLLRKHVGRP
jgi:hypothetical protein